VLFAIILACAFPIGARSQDSNQQSQSQQDGSKSDPDQKPGNGKTEQVKGDVAKGKALFGANCSTCHEVTDEEKVGPGLKGVSKKYDPAALRRRIQEGGDMMPPVASTNGLSEQDVSDIIAYLQTL